VLCVLLPKRADAVAEGGQAEVDCLDGQSV
jgi:hypothetical protein